MPALQFMNYLAVEFVIHYGKQMVSTSNINKNIAARQGLVFFSTESAAKQEEENRFKAIYQPDDSCPVYSYILSQVPFSSFQMMTFRS